MDKYEYRMKTEQMLEYVELKSYDKAMEIADTIDWRKVKNITMLNAVSEIYENMSEFSKARDILFIAYDRAPSSRKLVYKMGIIALKMGQIEEANSCYEEFMRMAPKDPNQYILRYKILKEQGAPLAKQIEALELFKRAEYIEKWAFELAMLYHEAGKITECIEECDDLILWFSEGEYVYKAMELKMKYKPLTPLQLEKYDGRLKSMRRQNRDKSIFKKPKDRPAPDPRIAQKIRENVHVTGSIDLPELPEPLEPVADTLEADLENLPDERPQPPRPRTKIENTSEILTTISGASLVDMIKTGVAVASAEDVTEEPVQEELQVTGQMKIEEILANWEKTQRANAQIIEAKRIENERRKKAKEAESTLAETKTILSDDIKSLMNELESDVTEEVAESSYEEVVEDSDDVFENMGEIVSNLQIEDSFEYVEEYEDDDFEESEEYEEEEIEESEEYEEEEIEESGEYEEEEIEESEEYEEEEVEESEEYEEEEVEESEEYEEEEVEEEEVEESEEYEEEEIEESEEYEDDGFEDDDEYEDDDFEDDEYEDDDFEDDDEYEDDDFEDDDEYEDDDFEDDDEYEEDDFEDDDEYEDDDFEDEEYEDDDFEDDDEYEDDDFEDDDEYEDDDFEDDDEYEDDDFEDDDEYEDDEFGIETDESEEEVVGQTADFSDIFADFEGFESEEPSFDDFSKTKEITRKEDVLEIEEPSEEEIAERLSKFDTGFIVQGRYDLSATSEIGLKLGLTEEQKKLFSYFVPIRGVSEQIVEVLDYDKRCRNRYGTSKKGNLLVIGRKGSGKTVLAVDMVKAIQKQRDVKQGRVAIVTGDSLNKKDLSGIIEKLHGGALIIEKAGKMNANTLDELNELMEGQTGELFFVLEDQRKSLERLLASNPQMKEKFNLKLELPIFINDELVTFGQTYAKENGYHIDEMGILALYSRIDMMQREDHAVTVSEVKEIMDEAIEHSQKANMKHLMKRVFGRSTDEKNRVILKEEDFKL